MKYDYLSVKQGIAVFPKMIDRLLSKKLTFLSVFLTVGIVVGLSFPSNAQKPQAKNLKTKPAPHFKPNKGQVADHEGNKLSEFEYVYQAPGMKMGLKKNGFSYNLYTVEEKPKGPISEATGKPVNKPKGEPGLEKANTKKTYHYHRVEVEFLGANEDPDIVVKEKTDHYANYYLSHCPEGITKVYGYQKLIYKDLYDNIDLVLKRKQNEKGKERLKYDIVVHPGGDLSDVRMAYKGMDGMSVQDGQLQITTSQGEMTETIPKSYWKGSGKNIEVDYQLKDGVVRFKAAAEKKYQTLVVDPNVTWSTYLGANDKESGDAIAIDGNSNLYVTGFTESTQFPTTSGAYQQSQSGGVEDGFLAKFSPNGNLMWSTYVGGSDNESGSALAIDGNNNVLVTGNTFSSDFPMKNAYQSTYGGSGPLFFGDAFLCKFTTSGNLSWSTFLGANDGEFGRGIATDPNDNVFITGVTKSSNFPVSSGAFQSSYGGDGVTTGGDAFLSKFSGNGNLMWSTFFGKSSGELSNGVATDEDGNAYITGFTNSKKFYVSNQAYQDTLAGGKDAFLSKFNSSGGLAWSSFLGGTNNDIGFGVATDRFDNVVVTGHTESTSFPVTADAYQTQHGGIAGTNDAFISKFSANGEIGWSTFLGGQFDEFSKGLATDGFGNVFIAGNTASSDFPTTSDTYQDSFSGGQEDAFLSRLSLQGGLSLSTFHGGSAADDISEVAADPNGNAYVTGFTESSDFPITSGAYQESIDGDFEAFISRFDFVICNKQVDTVVSRNGNTLKAEAEGAGYRWLNCDSGYQAVDGATSQYFTPSADGNYALEVTQNNCMDTSSCYQVEITTGIASNSSKASFEVYPNPVADQLTIVQSKNSQPQTFQLQTLTGKQIKSGKLSKIERVGVSNLSPGVYLLEVQSEDAVRTKKVVVE